MPAELAGCRWGLASRLSWSLQPIHWAAAAAADVLGGVALTARLMWWLGVVAPQGVVVMIRRGRSTRAQLPMRNVCDFHCGRFDESRPSHGASRVRVVIVVVAARGMSLTVFTIRWRTVELDLGGLCQPFGVPELSLSHQLSLEEVHPHLVLASILMQVLDLLSEEQIFLLCRRSAMSARWLPGLEKVPTSSVRGVGLL
jgi:hypothetical protein